MSIHRLRLKNCRRFLGQFEELTVSGRGARNLALMRSLAERLPRINLTATDEYGILVQAKVAIGFTIPAYLSLRKKPNNVPAATGAKRQVLMGKVSWGNKK